MCAARYLSLAISQAFCFSDQSEALTEARNIIASARLVVDAYESDHENLVHTSAIQELSDEFKKVEGER